MSFDFAVIGAGIAGASVASELAPHGRTVILEAEDMPGYHATGRSAAFWSETYGGPSVQPLTTASHGFLANPPSQFSERSFLSRLGALHLADDTGLRALDAFAREFADSDVALESIAGAELENHVPGLNSRWKRAVFEPTCSDIDVGGLHRAFLRDAKRKGAELRCSASAEKIARGDKGWIIAAGGQEFAARIVIDAAGAWADRIAALAGVTAIGIKPYRRTVIQLRTDPAPPEALPLVIDAAGTFYFKAEAGGRLWLSPHDETLEEPGDTAPEELDIAVAIDRFEKAVDWKVLAVERKWAGQRSFAPDRLPIYGFDPKAPDFFWCAGQGGFGIQTAPAAAKLCRALILDEPLDPMVANIEAKVYAPARF